MNIQKSQQGFTLIELMIVVAIIGILASIALPAYNTYIARSKFTEVILSTSGVKTAVEMCMLDERALAGCDDGGSGAGWSITAVVTGTPGKVDTVSTANGVITATAIGATGTPVEGLEGETYVLTPTVGTGKLSWAVTGTCLTNGLC